MSADGEIDRIIVLLQLFERYIVWHRGVAVHFDTLRDYPVDLAIKLGAREAICRDAVAHHSA